MARRLRYSTVGRVLLPLLVLSLLLGHACELSAAVPVSMSSHGADDGHGAGDGHHHSSEGHADRALVSCDAIDGLPNTGAAELAPGHVGTVLSAISAAPARLVARSLEPSSAPPPRPLLFLLYASLLI